MCGNRKIVLLATCILCVSFLLIACDPPLRYIGENVELMSVALYSVPGLQSDRYDQLIVLDTDQYGRTLFAVLFTASGMIRDNFGECVLGVFVAQGSDESASYFYAERNYMLSLIDAKVPLTEELVQEHFSMDAINALKQQNDWDISPEEVTATAVAVPITVEKSRRLEKGAQKAIEARVGTDIRVEFFRYDNTGKILYFILNVGGKHAYYEWYLAMLDASGNLIEGPDSMVRLDDIPLEDMPATITEFLEKNNWVHITAIE